MKIGKTTKTGVSAWFRHDNRLIRNDKNGDIDPDRSKNNYVLTPYIDIPRDEQYSRRQEIYKLEYEKFKDEISKCYVYNRKDVNLLCSAVVQLPEELVNAPEAEQESFFLATTEFLTERYGDPISVTVHVDEGKNVVIKDEKVNKNIFEFHVGRKHLHFTFIPKVKIDHDKLHKQKKYPLDMDKFEYKVSANDVINKKDLKTLHPDFQKFLEARGFKCNVNTGITADQGGNKTVEELKKSTELKAAALEKVVDKSIQKLHAETISVLEKALDREKEKNVELQAKLESITKERDAAVAENLRLIERIHDQRIETHDHSMQENTSSVTDLVNTMIEDAVRKQSKSIEIEEEKLWTI